MQALDKRKLNLLLHLAKVDGKFTKSEKELLQQFATEKSLDTGILETEELPMRFSEFTEQGAKVELLYWALKLVHADGIIHEKEMLFCRNLAMRLNFKEEIVSFYLENPIPEYSVFEQAVKTYSSVIPSS